MELDLDDGPMIVSPNRPPHLDAGRWTGNPSSRRADTGDGADRDPGGPGSYRWDRPAMSNGSRDLAFLWSFERDRVVKRTHSKNGPVPRLRRIRAGRCRAGSSRAGRPA